MSYHNNIYNYMIIMNSYILDKIMLIQKIVLFFKNIKVFILIYILNLLNKHKCIYFNIYIKFIK